MHMNRNKAGNWTFEEVRRVDEKNVQKCTMSVRGKGTHGKINSVERERFVRGHHTNPAAHVSSSTGSVQHCHGQSSSVAKLNFLSCSRPSLPCEFHQGSVKKIADPELLRLWKQSGMPDYVYRWQENPSEILVEAVTCGPVWLIGVGVALSNAEVEMNASVMAAGDAWDWLWLSTEIFGNPSLKGVLSRKGQER